MVLVETCKDEPKSMLMAFSSNCSFSHSGNMTGGSCVTALKRERWVFVVKLNFS